MAYGFYSVASKSLDYHNTGNNAIVYKQTSILFYIVKHV